MFTAQELFVKTFDAITDTIPFQKEWSNGTGYFDHAVKGEHAPKLRPGRIVKVESPGHRKMMLVGTPVGNVVVFSRYSDRDDVYVTNAPQSIYSTGLIESGRVTDRMMGIILGQWGDGCENVGELLQNLVEESTKSERDAARI